MNCYRTTIPKVNPERLLFNLAQGLRNCWAKQLFVKAFWSSHQGGMYSFIFFIAKNKEKLSKMCFPLIRWKTILPIWGALKMLNFFCKFQIPFWRLFFEVKERHLQIFERKNVNFKVSVILSTLKLWRASAAHSRQNLPIFRI